jgi:hypothetical protein
MSVVDGLHRVVAHKLQGAETIEVDFFDGSEVDCFIESVRANITHGKPLNLAEREHAGQKVLDFYPAWSDRAIGQSCGLSPRTIASLRRRAHDTRVHTTLRRGLDGRSRPIDTRPSRLKAANLLQSDPRSSMRQVAEATGTSVATIRDVRARLEKGLSPIPVREARSESSETTDPATSNSPDERQYCESTSMERSFVRWFDQHCIRRNEWETLIMTLSARELPDAIASASEQRREWTRLAACLKARQAANGDELSVSASAGYRRS